MPGTHSPDYATDEGLVVVSWDLGRVKQSERRDVPAFSLKAAPPGPYDVEWEMTAEGLPKPLEGELSVVVEPPMQADRSPQELHDSVSHRP